MNSVLKLLLVFGAAFLIYGTAQLCWGWYYADIAKREAAALGTIRVFREGRHNYYEYTFQVGSRILRDNDNHCETAQTGGACFVGTPVLVYYDRDDPSKSQLNDYGRESSRSFGQGRWMTPLGASLLLGFYLGVRSRSDTEDDKPEESDDEVESEIIHIVPDDKA